MNDSWKQVFKADDKNTSYDKNTNEQLIANAIQGMSDEMIQNVLLYISFLKFSTQSSENTSADQIPFLRKHKTRTFNLMQGRIEMADDFDEIPEGFEDYISVCDYSKPIVLKLEGEQGIKAMIEILTSPRTRYDAKAEAEKAKAELRKQGLEL